MIGFDAVCAKKYASYIFGIEKLNVSIPFQFQSRGSNTRMDLIRIIAILFEFYLTGK